MTVNIKPNAHPDNNGHANYNYGWRRVTTTHVTSRAVRRKGWRDFIITIVDRRTISIHSWASNTTFLSAGWRNMNSRWQGWVTCSRTRFVLHTSTSLWGCCECALCSGFLHKRTHLPRFLLYFNNNENKREKELAQTLSHSSLFYTKIAIPY